MLKLQGQNLSDEKAYTRRIKNEQSLFDCSFLYVHGIMMAALVELVVQAALVLQAP